LIQRDRTVKITNGNTDGNSLCLHEMNLAILPASQ
jgi:hypothetical protein